MSLFGVLDSAQFLAMDLGATTHSKNYFHLLNISPPPMAQSSGSMMLFETSDSMMGTQRRL